MKRLHLKSRGFTLVEIMIVVAIIALLAVISIPNLLQAKKYSNDTLAKGTLRSTATSAETWATGNNGNYPTDETSLQTANPGYKMVCGQTMNGYSYTCVFAATGYTVTATPVSANLGTQIETVSTGGSVTP